MLLKDHQARIHAYRDNTYEKIISKTKGDVDFQENSMVNKNKHLWQTLVLLKYDVFRLRGDNFILLSNEIISDAHEGMWD